MTDKEGYGYEWDAMLVGGPADGCLDRVIAINNNEPPGSLIRIMDGTTMRRESLGEKLIERLTRDQLDGSQRVSVYELRLVEEDDKCIYDYAGIMTMDDYRDAYLPGYDLD